MPHWFYDWSLYLALAMAALLRFFRLQTVEFDFDQANLFGLARETITHGLIPLSSNTASIGTLHAPFFVYLLLPAAALSANPLGGAITVSLLTTAAAGLTYLFTRRYFGWSQALIAGLLYATGLVALRYGRGIWQPDVLTFFLLLFLFAVFRGAIERKGGWFAPAVALLGMLYQLDPSSIIAPGVMIALALLLAPETVRWRDTLLAASALIVLFSPYLLLQLLTNFADVKATLAFLHLPAQTDGQVFQFYWVLLFPFNGLLTPWMNLLGYCLEVLLALGLLVAVLRLLRPHERAATLPAGIQTANHLARAWQCLRHSPERVSLLLLLAWQIVPFASLIHHSVALHMQYLLVFLPGPYILMGLALAEGVSLIARWHPRFPQAQVMAQAGVLLFSALLVIGQLLGTSAALIGATDGNFNDRRVQNIAYTNDLNSLWNALHQADDLAEQRHISHLFISMDGNTEAPLTSLSATLRTPTTVFGYDDCLMLPAPGSGPAVYLIGPYADDVDALLHQFASASLVAEPPRLGGKPFRLYIATPKTSPAQTQAAALPTIMTAQNTKLAVTRWTITRTVLAAPRTLYNEQFTLPVTPSSLALTTTCAATVLHSGDQWVVALPVTMGATAITPQAIQGSAFDTMPVIYRVGPFHFTAFLTETVPRPFALDLRLAT